MNPSILEIVPPPMQWSKSEIDHYIQQIIHLLKNLKINSICIPEVVEEDREGVRTIAFAPKMDPYEFSCLIKKDYPDLIPILFKVSVIMNKNDFMGWVKEVYQNGIRQIVLVGGGRHDKIYPGYTVAEATQLIKQHYPQMKVGAMTIFSRINEELRIFEKLKAGVDFFYSQIVFETMNAKLVLSHLRQLCQQNALSFPPIYISLAVAAAKEDVGFMKWLGVEFPSAVYHYLVEPTKKSLSEKTMEVNEMLLDDFNYWRQKEDQPLFFKVEHIIYNNLNLSAQLYQAVQRVFG